MKSIYSWLESPRLYNLVQSVLTIGGTHQVRELFADFVDQGCHHSVLELGCGTGTWALTTAYKQFVRVDINDKYFPAVTPPGMVFKSLDAADLSYFADGSFDLIYSMGLYHHMPDEAVKASLRESARVLVPNGRVVIFDAILPTSRLNLPAWAIRKLDRGRWVRSQAHLEALLDAAGVVIRRSRRCRWGPGLEGCFCEFVPGSTTSKGLTISIQPTTTPA